MRMAYGRMLSVPETSTPVAGEERAGPSRVASACSLASPAAVCRTLSRRLPCWR